MKLFSKAMFGAAALSMTALPVAASAADVRPADARVSVNAASMRAVSQGVRVGAEQTEQSNDLFGFRRVPIIVIIGTIAITIFVLIKIFDNGSKSP